MSRWVVKRLCVYVYEQKSKMNKTIITAQDNGLALFAIYIMSYARAPPVNWWKYVAYKLGAFQLMGNTIDITSCQHYIMNTQDWYFPK